MATGRIIARRRLATVIAIRLFFSSSQEHPPFDGALIFAADDEESATAAMLHPLSQGYVTTQTARAFKSAEVEAILGKLPALGMKRRGGERE
jgi:hypothetical protein